MLTTYVPSLKLTMPSKIKITLSHVYHVYVVTIRLPPLKLGAAKQVHAWLTTLTSFTEYTSEKVKNNAI